MLVQQTTNYSNMV